MIPLLVMATVIVTASVAAALAALLLLSCFDAKWRGKATSVPQLDATIEPAVFLFEDQELVDATGPAQALIDALPAPGSEWQRLAAYMTTKIPDFTQQMSALAQTSDIVIQSPTDPDFRLHAQYLNGIARLTLTDLAAEGQGIVVDGLSFRAQEAELASLRQIAASLPVPIWRLNAENNVLWANSAYISLTQTLCGDDDLTWPLPRLFDIGSERTKRLTLTGAGAARWFDCHSHPMDHGALQYAMSADAVVKAESALREFVQTLTKTFAHLPIGLAIFNKQRQLVMFNPALTDLTSLGPEFLSARPTLFAFLDRLRDARIVPEPKDYTGWRQRMTELEKAASMGLYEETWPLPTGQTYKVTGRPHPDGAVALLIEDISAEISLSRRFRAELELGQSVIDSLAAAVAVFSPMGELVMSNTAYAALWGVDPGTSLSSISIIDATRHWANASDPSPIWGDLRDFVGETAQRAEWGGDIALLDGTLLACLVTPMAGGATLVKFAKAGPERGHIRRIRRMRDKDNARSEAPRFIGA